MADGTHIEWTEATWNPITGCSVKSPGCTNCYAMKLAGTRLQHHESRKGLTVDTKAGPVWTGEVRFNEQWLDQPLRWKRPRMIFVCAHGDLFHESVPDEWIDRVFAVMALAPQHTFQVLTKRSKRMREYLSKLTFDGHYVRRPGWGAQNRRDGDRILLLQEGQAWPLPNVWLGVSVEDQTRADERIPDLLATPAAVRWLSMEPLLGPVDLEYIQMAAPVGDFTALNALTGSGYFPENDDGDLGADPCEFDTIDWIVVGGESGAGARPMHPDWVRSIRDQCADAGVPFFFKQWGDWLPGNVYTETVDGVTRGGLSGFPDSPIAGETYPGKLCHWWGEADSFTPGTISVQIGKKASGRLLDGVEHNGMPA